MPSMASASPFFLGLADNVDKSFFDELGKGIDDSVGIYQEAEKSSVCKDFEQKFIDASDCTDHLRRYQSEKAQQQLGSVDNAMANLKISENGHDLIVSSLLERAPASCVFSPLLIASRKALSLMQQIPTAAERDKPSTKVTEVEWSSFKSDQGEFGSYSDFFSEISTIPVDRPWNVEADKRAETGHILTHCQMKHLNGDPSELETFHLKALEPNIHQHVTQYNMVNIEPSQSLYVGQTGCDCQVIQPLLSNSMSSREGITISYESTMEYTTAPHAVSTTVTDCREELLAEKELNHNKSVETYMQQNEELGGQATGNSCNEQSLYYDPQYPGWCYNSQTQEWCEIPGYIQGQMDITDNVAGSSQLNVAEEEDLSKSGTSQLSDAYVCRDVHNQTHNGAYSQQAESFGVDQQHYSSILMTKQNVYNPVMEEKQISSAENYVYTASGGSSWTTPSSVQNWQTQGLEKSEKEINLSNSLFPYTRETSQLSQPMQVARTGDRNLGFDSKESTQLFTGSIPNSYVPQYSKNSEHAPSHSIAQTPPNNIHEALSSSAGRPPHSNLSFGFGGRLVIVHPKDFPKFGTVVGEQSNRDSRISGPIQIYELSQVVNHGTDYGGPYASNFSFATLGSEIISGPLLSGSLSHKDILKWIDEKAFICETERFQNRNSESLRILWGSLKIACQHYGKLRSGPGIIGIAPQGENSPEVALAKLLEPKQSESAWTDSLRTLSLSRDCLKPLPAEPQLQATANEMKRLLLAGKQKEALQCAQHGQLWGPALVLARQLGEKPYADAVAEMARHQFWAGSPLQILSLLFAGQAHEVFAGKIMSPPSKPFTMENAIETPLGGEIQDGVDGLLRQWQENLAIMAANRTNGDEQVIMHLGDCLWERHGEVAAAHTCYLIADANFESFSSNSRLCLIGADHYKYPRTFACPEAIQCTELYEYCKVMGNPQFILVPFQPYKLVYASMLAEVGKVAEALRYCLAVLKILRTAGRTREVEYYRQVAAALEDRLRIHSQAGNLAPSKLMGRFLSTLDKSIHRIMGAPPPPSNPEKCSTPTVDPSITLLEAVSQPAYSSLKTNTMSLVPSASMEPICDSSNIRGWTSAPARSISEPDFSKGTTKDISQDGKPEKRSSYLGHFGSQLAKAAGFMAKLNSKEAKLGEKNKFYYNEKLKRWVEEGVELPVEEAILPPPPTVFRQTPQTDLDPQHVKSSSPEAFPSGGSGSHMSSLGTPPIPPCSNQFSARARHQGVRSRYVDTFNKREPAAPSRAVESPLPPLINSCGESPAKFFVPALSPATQLDESIGDQVANGRSNDAVRPLENPENPNAHCATYSSQTESLTAAAVAYDHNGYVNQSEDPSLRTSAFNFTTPVGKTMKRASSADSTNIVNSASWNDNCSTRNSDVSKSRTYVPNGVHSRAASWSDYPVSYGLAAERHTDVYSYQLETIETKDSMKRLLFSTTDFSSSAGSYSSDIHSKLLKGVIPGSSIPAPPLLDVNSSFLMNGGAAVDVVGGLHMSTTQEKGVFNISMTANDLQEVEL